MKIYHKSLKNKNLNKFIITSIVIILQLLISGCQKEKQDSIVIIGENSSNLIALNSLKSEYENNSNIKIEFKPHTFEDAFNLSNQDFVNHTGLYDIIMQYNFSLSSFIRNKYITPIEELTNDINDSLLNFENEIFQNAWKEVGYYYTDIDSINSGITKVGYPFAINTMLLAYNRKLFENPNHKIKYRERFGEKLSPPKTWAQYRQIAEYFTIPDESLYGICLQGATGSWLYYEWCNFLFSMGGTVMNKTHGWEGNVNSEILLDTDNAILATKYYKSLKPFNAGDYFTVGAFEQVNLMKKGNIAMVIMWSDLAYYLIDRGDGSFDNRFSFEPIPGNVSGLAGGSFFINNDSKNKTESLNYIIDVMQTENQIKLLKKGLCSSNRKAYQDTEVQTTIPYAKALYESLDRGIYMFEAGPDADIISNKVTKYIQKIWTDELSISDGLLELTKEIKIERKLLYQKL